MRTNYVLMAAFVVVAVAQLYVPSSMIIEREDVLKNGRAYRFETRPIDPTDPMRGKYITLRFTNDECTLAGNPTFAHDDILFAHITENESGFAEIGHLSKEEPAANIDYIRVRAQYPQQVNDSTHVGVEYDFNRFYMDEKKAPIAEELYRESRRDSLQATWAVVRIKDGAAVLEDVMINGVSIGELAGQMKLR
jgi:uncharacterized membrane-anchored protein